MLRWSSALRSDMVYFPFLPLRLWSVSPSGFIHWRRVRKKSVQETMLAGLKEIAVDGIMVSHNVSQRPTALPRHTVFECNPADDASFFVSVAGSRHIHMRSVKIGKR